MAVKVIGIPLIHKALYNFKISKIFSGKKIKFARVPINDEVINMLNRQPDIVHVPYFPISVFRSDIRLSVVPRI